MLKEFRAFAVRGNVLDLAVGIIIGAAFTTVVNSLVGDVIMQGVAAIAGQPDFSDLIVTVGGGSIRYGSFLTTVVNFLIVAFVLFLLVKGINKLVRPKDASDEAPSIRECPYCKLAVPATATKCQGCASEIQPLAA